jgi:hypothetical protein
LQNPQKKLQYTEEVVVFLEEILSTHEVPTFYTQSKPQILKQNWHVEIDAIDMSNPFWCDTIPRFQELHSICSIYVVDPTLFMAKKISCFCAFVF